MTRREYVLDVWWWDNWAWLATACVLIGAITAPTAPGFLAAFLAWVGASLAWFGVCLLLVGLMSPDWRRQPDEGAGENVVPLRPPPSKGLH